MRLTIVLVILACLWSLGSCSDSSGPGARDSDVVDRSDSDSEIEPDADHDVDADESIHRPDSDAPENPVCDLFWGDNPGGEEVCGNCVDEDGNGEAPSCGFDDIYLTPRLVASGSTLTVRGCTTYSQGYPCVDAVCFTEDECVKGYMTDRSRQMGLSCWEFEMILESPGQWRCSFRRLQRNDDGECSDEIADERACDVVDVTE